MLIDPVRAELSQYLRLIDELELRLVFAIDTHVHADHVTALGDLRTETSCATLIHQASMGKMGAACVASAGSGFLSGSAASMTMYPVVPDYERFPEHGRDLGLTFGELGSAGHWIKRILHSMFIYKAKARFGWWLIPE